MWCSRTRAVGHYHVWEPSTDGLLVVRRDLDLGGNEIITGPWSKSCGGCTFSGNYAGAPLARTGSCATDCTSLDLGYRAITSMPGDPFADMGALQTLNLRVNDLSSLETGVFDALVSLRYVGEGESARVGSCGDG